MSIRNWLAPLVLCLLCSLGASNGARLTAQAQQGTTVATFTTIPLPTATHTATATLTPAPTTTPTPTTPSKPTFATGTGMTPLRVIIGSILIVGATLSAGTLIKMKKVTTNHSQIWLAVVTAILVLGGGYLLIRANYSYDWVGLGDYHTPIGEFKRGKTLWDWLDLLIVPIILLFVGLGVNWQLNRTQNKIQGQRDKTEHEIQEKRDETEREIAENRAQEDARQIYLDRMTELLLKEKLRESIGNVDLRDVRDIARAQTQAALRRLQDGKRKGTLIQFLYQSSLIVGIETVIDLEKADLIEADLSWIDLTKAHLKKTTLTNAHLLKTTLVEADLRGADLRGADLRGADLRGADLREADLTNADLTDADLTGAYLNNADLTGATVSGKQLELAEYEYIIKQEQPQT